MSHSEHKSSLSDYLKSHKNGSSPRKTASGPNKTSESTIQPVVRPKTRPNSQRKSVHSSKNRQFRRPTNEKLFSSKLAYSKVGKADIECLPEEILLEIFEYLSPQDLLSCGRVCKRWHSLASDNLLWQDIYKKYAENASKGQKGQKSAKIPKNPPLSFWKSFCVQRGADFRNNRAFKLIEKKRNAIDPFTGLHRETQSVLQKAGVRWVLCFVDVDDKEHSVFQNNVFYFGMSVCVRWYNFTLPSVHRIKKLKVYAGNPIFFDDKGQATPNSPLQRSLLYEQEFKLRQITSGSGFVGTDDIVKVFSLPDGVMIATWTDGSDIAFIAMSFHADHLVQRCLLGKGNSIWQSIRHRPQRDDIDSRYGLHSYSCTLELRNMRTSFWKEQFRNLHCLPEYKDGCAIMQLIDPERSYQRSWIEKKFSLPWTTEALKGIVKDVGILDVTVLDDQSKPIWCTSDLVKLSGREETSAVTYEYEGDYSTLKLTSALGKIEMILIWEASSKKYFITSLQLHLSLGLINRWYATRY